MLRRKAYQLRGARRAVVAGVLAAGMLLTPVATTVAWGQETASAQAASAQEEAQAATAQETAQPQAASSSSSSASGEIAGSYLDGALGFYEWLGDETAVALIESAAQNRSYGSYVDLDSLLTTNNPLSLDAMRQSLEILEAANAVRASVDESDLETTGGEQPGELLVSTYLMAAAQVDVSYSDDVIGHLAAYNVGENLAWGYRSAQDAVSSGWYGREKTLWETIYSSSREWFIGLLRSGTSYNSALGRLSSTYPSVYSAVGHYLNVISPDYEYTGVAYSTGNATYGRTYGQTYLWSSMGGKTYTVSEFTELLNEYYDAVVFTDVPGSSGEWYVETVYEAAALGYMSGYGDGTTFGLNDSLNRADAVMVLWNMAGRPGSEETAEAEEADAEADADADADAEADAKADADADADAEADAGDSATYDLPYTDIDEGAYYAPALAWATELGIVSGDGDGGVTTFRPGDAVSRQELAKMLYMYERAQGNTYDVDAGQVLASCADAGEVADWAREYVAWLVAEKVMGVGSDLNPRSAITRAEVAAMAVRVQPDGQLDG